MSDESHASASAEGLSPAIEALIEQREQAQTIQWLTAQVESYHRELDKAGIGRCDNLSLRIEELAAQREKAEAEVRRLTKGTPT